MLIRFNEARILRAFGTVIVPGIQEVSSSFCAKMKAHKTLGSKFEQGLLEVISEGDDAVASFLVMNANQIKNILKGTHDLQLLSDWRAREARESVKALINERIKVLVKVEYRDGTKGELTVPPPRVKIPVSESDDELDDLELDAPVKETSKKPKARSAK